MRLRRKPRKSYRDHILNDEEEENEGGQEAIPITGNASSDDDFDGEGAVNAEPPSEEDHDDEGDASEASSGGADGGDDDDEESDASGGGTTGAKREYTFISEYTPGTVSRKARTRSLRRGLFGPTYEGLRVIYDMEDRFDRYYTLPPRHSPENPDTGVVPSPWIPEDFEAEQAGNALRWYAAFRQGTEEPQSSRLVPARNGPRLMPRPDGDMAVLLGPHERQKEVRLTQGVPLLLSPSGLPADDPDAQENTPSGWIFDAGGIVLAMDWAPTSAVSSEEAETESSTPQVERDTVQESVRTATQLLAIATVPFSDQEPSEHGEGKIKYSDTVDMAGSIQFWEFTGSREAGKLASPTNVPPRLAGVKCFDWGHPKRLQWCPTSLLPSISHGLLAVLCGDGKVRVLDVPPFPATGTQYEWMEAPAATLGETNEYNSAVTCMAWVNINRIVLGHRDGCLTLWSIYPRRLLQRIPVVQTYIVDICTGYPSKPSLVIATPIGGSLALVDLSQPSSEYTYYPVASISLQPYTIGWSELMQGFLALSHHTTLAFMHSRVFYQGRAMLGTPSNVNCISAGHTHPFVLVGCVDGSLWSFNLMLTLFREKGEPGRPKLKVFENEFRPVQDRAQKNAQNHNGSGSAENGEKAADRPLRGAVRILQNFMPEKNEDPRKHLRMETLKKARPKKPPVKKVKGHGRGKKNVPAPPEGEEAEDVVMEEAGEAGEAAPAAVKERKPLEPLEMRLVIHEPLTRIMCVVWNPNVDFSCWAACAMGSGLVRVMDLGVE